VDISLSAREEAIKLLKFHLQRAQNHMVQQANKRRSDRNFSVGDFVYLKLHPYRQVSMRSTSYHKLMPKFYGPFKVLDRIGLAAYQLDPQTLIFIMCFMFHSWKGAQTQLLFQSSTYLLQFYNGKWSEGDMLQQQKYLCNGNMFPMTKPLGNSTLTCYLSSLISILEDKDIAKLGVLWQDLTIIYFRIYNLF